MLVIFDKTKNHKTNKKDVFVINSSNTSKKNKACYGKLSNDMFDRKSKLICEVNKLLVKYIYFYTNIIDMSLSTENHKRKI